MPSAVRQRLGMEVRPVQFLFQERRTMKKSKRMRRTQVRRSKAIEDLREEAKSTAPSNEGAVIAAIVAVLVAAAVAIFA